jgi:Domain of unknown function (DUF4112)
LFPGLGDAAGAIISGYIVLEAARLGATRSTLVRMTVNILIEAAIGVVPVLGDLFDAAWKANERNITLLERHLESPGHSLSHDQGFVLVLAMGGLSMVAAIVAGGVLLVRWILSMT